jgi:hypothetical protein
MRSLAETAPKASPPRHSGRFPSLLSPDVPPARFRSNVLPPTPSPAPATPASSSATTSILGPGGGLIRPVGPHGDDRQAQPRPDASEPPVLKRDATGRTGTVKLPSQVFSVPPTLISFAQACSRPPKWAARLLREYWRSRGSHPMGRLPVARSVSDWLGSSTIVARHSTC